MESRKRQKSNTLKDEGDRTRCLEGRGFKFLSSLTYCRKQVMASNTVTTLFSGKDRDLVTDTSQSCKRGTDTPKRDP